MFYILRLKKVSVAGSIPIGITISCLKRKITNIEQALIYETSDSINKILFRGVPISRNPVSRYSRKVNVFSYFRFEYKIDNF